MIETLASKASTGDLYLHIAKRHLSQHEWGEAWQAVDRALAKGRLSDLTEALDLLQSVSSILGIGVQQSRSLDPGGSLNDRIGASPATGTGMEEVGQ